MLTVVCFYFQEIAYGYVSNSGEKVTNDWLKQGTYEIGNLFNKKTHCIHNQPPIFLAIKHIFTKNGLISLMYKEKYYLIGSLTSL